MTASTRVIDPVKRGIETAVAVIMWEDNIIRYIILKMYFYTADKYFNALNPYYVAWNL